MTVPVLLRPATAHATGSPTAPRPRVLQLGKYYPPFRGGMETHLRHLCRELRARVDVRAVVSAADRRTSYDVVDRIVVTRLGTLCRVAGASVSPGMGAVLRASAADLVHVHLPNPPAVLAYLNSGHPGPVVATYHSDIVRQKVLGRAFEPVLRRFLGRCAAVIVSSQSYLDSSPILRDFRDRCHVIPFGIPLQALDRVNEDEVRAIGARYGPRLVLAVGRQVGYKGFDVLVRAMARVDGRLLLVGDGPLRAQLEQEARTAGVGDRVSLLGEVVNVLPYMRAAHVFVLPSVTRAEAFGIVQLEAMACGRPVVNTGLDSGVPFVSVDGETGLTVRPGDERALAAAITRLLDDGELRTRYGAAGRARVEREFSLEVMTRRTLALYDDVMRRATRARAQEG